MSQAGIINVAGGGGGGTPVQTVSTQSGTAVPVGNDILIDAFDSKENNDNGVTTKGGAAAGDQYGNTPPVPGLPKEVSLYLTNRATYQIQTTNNVPDSTQIFALGTTPGTYIFWGNIIGYNTTATLGASYEIAATVRTTGGAGVEISTEVKNARTEGVMSGCVVTVGVSANFFVFSIQGLAANIINWNTLLEYRFVS